MIGTGASGVQAIPELAKRRRAGDGVPAHPAVDGAQGRPPLQRKGIGAVPAQPAAATRRTRWQDLEDSSMTTPRSLPTTRWWPHAGHRHLVPGAHGRRRGASARAHAGLSRSAASGCCWATTTTGRCSRTTSSWSPIPIDRITDNVGRDHGRRGASTSTRSCWPPDSRPVRLPVGYRGDRQPAGRRLHERVGRRPHAPTWAWRSADSRTSSCSTGPTRTRAATRSSTSSRPAPDWWSTR